MRGIWVEGATEYTLNSVEMAMKLISRGINNRITGSHRLNDVSSRSHCIIMLTILQSTGNNNKQAGRLYMVDLAGSKTVKKTGMVGKHLDEAKYINKVIIYIYNIIFFS